MSQQGFPLRQGISFPFAATTPSFDMKNHTLIAFFLLWHASSIFSEEPISVREIATLDVIRSQIDEDYRSTLQSLVISKAPQEKFREAKLLRDKQYHGILKGAKERNIEQLSVDELIAVTECHEHLLKWTDGLPYAQEALKRSPDSADAYAPIIRILLNMRRTEDASVLLSNAKSRLGSQSKVFELDLFLAIRRKEEGDLKLSAEHLFSLYHFYLLNASCCNSSLQNAVGHLKLLEEVIEPAGKNDQFKTEFKQLDEKVQELMKARAKNESHTQDDFIDTCLLFNLQHGIHRIGKLPKLGDIQGDWLSYISQEFSNQRNTNLAIRQIAKFTQEAAKAPRLSSDLIDTSEMKIKASIDNQHTEQISGIYTQIRLRCQQHE